MNKGRLLIENEKIIPGFNDRYAIGKIGYVVNLKTSRILKPGFSGREYLFVVLSGDNIHKNLYIHRLVALNFVPNPNNKSQVNHINGIKTDNRAENLEWVTPSENILHSFKNGLSIPHYKNNIIKINFEEASRIRCLYLSGMRQSELASIYGVDQSAISHIVNNKTWKND
jgi:hypothetical protein